MTFDHDSPKQRVRLPFLHQSCLDRIGKDVCGDGFEIRNITLAMVVEARLSEWPTTAMLPPQLRRIRLGPLHHVNKSDRSDLDQQMQVIGHDADQVRNSAADRAALEK